MIHDTAEHITIVNIVNVTSIFANYRELHGHIVVACNLFNSNTILVCLYVAFLFGIAGKDEMFVTPRWLSSLWKSKAVIRRHVRQTSSSKPAIARAMK